MKKKILLIIACILAVISTITTLVIKDEKTTEVVKTAQNIVIEEIEKQDLIVSEETIAEAENTIKEVENGREIESTDKAEKIDENELEKDACVNQDNIEYNGDIKGNGLKLLGAYKGLTYYSQADKRWANDLYTSTGNKKQTMKSSACGPTCGAMVVSSSKGAILPTTMAKLSVDNGYRTANSGTAWAYFPFIADFFDFKEYYSTSKYKTAYKYLKEGYYVVCACGQGLFTTGGHYIVLVGDKDGKIEVFDPYLYNGKFNTATRKKAKVKVDGNAVYVTEKNFEKYANVQHFWVFSNDKGAGNTKTVKKKKKSTVGKKKTLKKKCNLYSKKNLKGTEYTYLKGTKVKILKNINSKVDYVKVIKTGRKAYINKKYYK